MSKEQDIREIRIKNKLALNLGYENGVRVMFTDSIRSQEDIDELGINHHYIFCVICGKGVEAKTYYGSTHNHDFLKEAVAEVTSYKLEDLRCGQIEFRGTPVRLFGETIKLHEPLSSGRIARLAELKSLVGGIQRNLWGVDHVFIRDGDDRLALYYPKEGRFEIEF